MSPRPNWEAPRHGTDRRGAPFLNKRDEQQAGSVVAMSQWGGCLRRIRQCLQRLLEDELDEEAVGLFEADKVGGRCSCCN